LEKLLIPEAANVLIGPAGITGEIIYVDAGYHIIGM